MGRGRDPSLLKDAVHVGDKVLLLFRGALWGLATSPLMIAVQLNMRLRARRKDGETSGFGTKF